MIIVLGVVTVIAFGLSIDACHRMTRDYPAFWFEQSDNSINRLVKEMDRWQPLGHSNFKLSANQLRMLNTITKYRDLLKIKIKKKQLYADEILQLDYQGMNINTVSFVYAGYMILFTFIAVIDGVWFAFVLTNPKSVDIWTVVCFVVFMMCFLGLIFRYGLSLWLAKSIQHGERLNDVLPLNHKTVPVIKFSGKEQSFFGKKVGGDAYLFGDVIRDLNLIYRVNVRIMPNSREKFINAFNSVKPTDSKFWAIAETVQKLDKKTLDRLVAGHDPLVDQITEFVQEYRGFLEKLLRLWLDLSIMNKQQCQQMLIQLGDQDHMDEDTKVKYFHNVVKSIGELNK